MHGYKAALEYRKEALFCAIFTIASIYHNTPFAKQYGHAAICVASSKHNF